MLDSDYCGSMKFVYWAMDFIISRLYSNEICRYIETLTACHCGLCECFMFCCFVDLLMACFLSTHLTAVRLYGVNRTVTMFT